jgi:hypothetical protein
MKGTPVAAKDVSLMQPTVSYEIDVAGLMDRTWEDWLEAPHIQSTVKDGQPVTRLTVQFTDQAGLIGLLRQLHGMRLELLSVTRLGNLP